MNRVYICYHREREMVLVAFVYGLETRKALEQTIAAEKKAKSDLEQDGSNLSQ